MRRQAAPSERRERETRVRASLETASWWGTEPPQAMNGAATVLPPKGPPGSIDRARVRRRTLPSTAGGSISYAPLSNSAGPVRLGGECDRAFTHTGDSHAIPIAHLQQRTQLDGAQPARSTKTD